MKRNMPLCEVIRGLKPYERLIIFGDKNPKSKLTYNVHSFVEKEGNEYKVIDGKIRLFRSPVWAGAASIEGLKEPAKFTYKIIDLRA